MHCIKNNNDIAMYERRFGCPWFHVQCMETQRCARKALLWQLLLHHWQFIFSRKHKQHTFALALDRTIHTNIIVLLLTWKSIDKWSEKIARIKSQHQQFKIFCTQSCICKSLCISHIWNWANQNGVQISLVLFNINASSVYCVHEFQSVCNCLIIIK